MQTRGALIVNIGNYSAIPLSGLNLTYKSPGGCGQMSGQVELRPPYLGILQLRENARVEVFDGGGLVWRGRLEERAATIQYGSAVWRFTALGYAASLRDQFYSTSTTFASGTAIETIFTTVRGNLCPDIDNTDNSLVVATGRTLGAISADVNGKTAQDVFDNAAAIGDSNGNPLYWHIMPGVRGSTNKAVLELISRPTTPTYFIGMEQGAILDLSWALSRLYNRITVTWGATPTYTTVNNTASQAAAPDGYGVIKTMQISNSLIGAAADATNAGNALLTRFQRINPIASRITIPSTALISGSDGSTVLPWRILPGRMIRIRDLRPGSIQQQDYDFVISGWSWNEDSQMLTITPEGPDDVTNLLARYLRNERLS